MNKIHLVRYIAAAMLISMPIAARAEETNVEKAQTTKNRAIDAAKLKFRQAQEELCELTDGKVACERKRIQNKVKNAAETAETKIIETKNKID